MSYLPRKYKIVSVMDYTDEVRLFKVKCDLNPLPGKFIEVSIPGIGECPLASCSYEKNYVDILLRNAGSTTSVLFEKRKGDDIFIRGPYGKGFPMEIFEKKNLILIAGGTGIAPITSFISYIEKNRKKFGKVFIYFGFRDEENILLNDRIEKWKKKFHVYVGLSNDPDTKKYEKGYVNDIIERHEPVLEDTFALLCGPEAMMYAATDELNSFGINNDRIYWSMERRMECGFGSCGRCQLQDLYVCKDGPVFRYDEIKPRLDNENSSAEINK